MSADASGITFLTWTNANGTLEGTAEYAKAGDTASTSSDPVTATTLQLSGTESDGKVSLRIGGSILGTSLSGTINNTSLVLQVPNSSGGAVGFQTFTPASVTDFNNKVSALSSDIQNQRSDAAAAQLKQDFADALNAVSDDETAVRSASTALASATTTAQSAAANLTTLVSNAIVSGCFTSSASDQATKAFPDTLSAGNDLISASFDQRRADSALSTAIRNLTSLGPLPAENQDAVDRAASILPAAESAADAAYALANSIQSDANSSIGTVFSLPSSC